MPADGSDIRARAAGARDGSAGDGAATERLARFIAAVMSSRLIDPLEILLEDDAAIGPLRLRVTERAHELARCVLEDDDRGALVAIRLVSALYPSDAPFDPPPAWWRSPLGQAVLMRVGHPAAEHVTYELAGAMLAITRQGIHDLVKRGKLARHPAGGVTVASVRARLRVGTQPLSPA
ncbi:MAG: hypothetical protein ACR2L8_04585 [Solirubrobacteraceae bacterium]